MPYIERVVLPYGLLTIVFHDSRRYVLSYGELVVYENGRRIIRGRATPYAFRSVEQMRYDFERDVQSL